MYFNKNPHKRKQMKGGKSMDVSFKGFENLLKAFADDTSTDDFSLMYEVHQKVLDIKNLIQDVYDVHVEYNYLKSGDYYKVEIAFNPRNILSKETAEALKDLVDVCDNVYSTAKSLKNSTKKK